ncbi:hypothetical protein BGX30_007319, partial [Mortierella sp. GBA39]
HASPSSSPMMRPQEPTTLPPGSRNDGDGDNVQRAATSYHTKNSPLPRPLHLRRPIVTDTSITPSSKVVATIGRGVPVVVQNDDTNSPIEPPVVIIGKSPVLMALGLGTSMLAHSQSSASAASPKATPPAKSTARRESIRAIQFPAPISEEQDIVDESDENPFMSKEEFRRPAPQAILPEGFKHAQFTLPLLPLPPQSKKAANDDSSDDEVTELDTGRLVLEPYLTPAELAAHIPFPVPAVAPKTTGSSKHSSSYTFSQRSLVTVASSYPQKLNTNNTRVKPPPPTLPPPRGSRSNSSSQAGSERGMSPAPSLSYTSSNISTGLSIISSQPETIVTDVSSFVSLGDTPTTTASMFCTSPTFLPVLSPTSPTTPGRTFSVSTAGSPVTPRLPPWQSPLIEEGDVYSWMEGKFDNDSNDDDDDKVVVHQVKKMRVPEAVGGGTRLSRFNFDT